MVTKIYKFGAQWCAPCKRYSPIFHEVEKLYGDIEFNDVDVDSCTDEENMIMQENNIRNIPATLLLDENGKVVAKLIGAASAAELIKLIDENKNEQ